MESIDGTSTEKRQSISISHAVRGKANTIVKLGVRRDETKLYFDVKRDFNNSNILDAHAWDRAFGHGRRPSGRRTFLVL